MPLIVPNTTVSYAPTPIKWEVILCTYSRRDDRNTYLACASHNSSRILLVVFMKNLPHSNKRSKKAY